MGDWSYQKLWEWAVWDEMNFVLFSFLPNSAHSDDFWYIRCFGIKYWKRIKDEANDVADIRPEQLLEADGFIFGFPSRFGMMPSQFKAFLDATSELWASQALGIWLLSSRSNPSALFSKI